MAEWLNAGDVNIFDCSECSFTKLVNGVIVSYFNSKVNPPAMVVYVGPNPTLSTNGAEANGYKHFI